MLRGGDGGRAPAALLRARPLVDDSGAVEDADAGWNRAAWYGWQFMPLRDATRWMPETVRALEASVPLAHRFIGIARQRADCCGTLHSDRRNYLLSTLTGLDVPAGKHDTSCRWYNKPSDFVFVE